LVVFDSLTHAVSDQISPDAMPDQLRGLEKDLAAACEELEEYQRMIDDLPGIYEAKFGSRVHALAKEIRCLTEERHRLHLQIECCIQAEALLLSSSASAEESLPPSRQRFWRSAPWLPPVAVAAVSLGLVVVLGLTWQALKGRPTSQPPAVPPQTQPASSAAPRPVRPELRLRARDEVWVELHSADNRVLFAKTLLPGQTHAVPFVDGIRIRSGRPHLLDVAVGDQPLAPLGALNDYSWHTASPLDSGQTPVFRPEINDNAS
jgi:hypothetical protein